MHGGEGSQLEIEDLFYRIGSSAIAFAHEDDALIMIQELTRAILI